MNDVSLVGAAAVSAAVLVVGVAAFQAALALGLPLGEATLGGKARTRNGVLVGFYRPLAAAQAMILLLICWIVLARAGVVGAGLLAPAFLWWAPWVIVGFLVLNTVANLTAPHPVERWVMGSITLSVAILIAVVALLA